MRRMTFVVFLSLFYWVRPTLAQFPDETSGRVPELDAFHTPIYELWHQAWPAKDIAKLKSLLPDVEKAYAALAAAKLPGILREKQTRWDEKLKILAQSMKDYRSAAEQNNAEGVLKATESVHMNYEQMVRLVRPALKELDAFHQALYMLHHYYMPENKSDQIKASADSLSLRMLALNEALLPKRLEARADQFSDARTNLNESVKAFAEAVKTKKSKEMLGKLESTLHARYQVLEKVFD
jgi:hypothetical protein